MRRFRALVRRIETHYPTKVKKLPGGLENRERSGSTTTTLTVAIEGDEFAALMLDLPSHVSVGEDGT